MRLTPLRIVVATILFLGALRSWAESNVQLRLRIEGGSFSAALFVSGQHATNFILESSVDLKAWEVVYHAFGWPGTNPVHQIWPLSEPRPHAFWRAVPGASLDALKQQWLEKEPAEYTFRLRRMFSFWEGGIRGTVRVRNGSIVEVTNAADDRSNQPIAQPDLSQFLTITQVFEEIRRELEAGSQWVLVTYDSNGLFPARVFIDRWIGIADDEGLIEATAFVSVMP